MGKTQNYSIRFDENNLAIVKKATGIEKPQKLIDFLLNEFAKSTIKISTVFSSEIKISKQLTDKSFQQHMNEISELEYEEEYKKKFAEIEAAVNLTTKQKQLLMQNMKSSKL